MSPIVGFARRKQIFTCVMCIPVFSCLFSLFSVARALGQTSAPRPGIESAVYPEVKQGVASVVAAMPPATVLHFGILLQPSNQTELVRFIHNLSDPANANFRRFLTPDQFRQQFGPPDADYQAVMAFAESHGLTVTRTYKSHLLVDLSGTVAKIEAAFNIKMNVYKHPTEARTFYSPDREPTLALPFAVQSIVGLDDYATAIPALRPVAPEARNPAAGAGPGGLYLPSDMRAAYYGGSVLTGAGQVVGLIQLENFNISDVTQDLGSNATYTSYGSGYYQVQYKTEGTTFYEEVATELIDGASSTPNPSDPNGVAEAALDVAQSIGMAPGINEVIQYIGASPSDDYDIFAQIADENTAKQVGVSWAWNVSSISRLNGILSQMAAQGQNIFAATGDFGSWPYSSNPYYFPAEDPYVTAVGGTNLTTSGPGGSYVSETGWNGSGGGYSPQQYAIPSYQSYLNGLNGASTAYRNVPDVSLEASNDYACEFGSCGAYVGTSFATPRWAGIMALANQQAAQNGDTSIGFVNPIIYSIGAGNAYSSDFHDVISGSNGAFSAATNYDLVTGLGTPKVQALIDALQVGAAPLPWTATVTEPQGSGCAFSGAFSMTTSQQTNANSLLWNVNISENELFINQINWSMEDGSGPFLSGSLTSNSPTNFDTEANRAPVGTPTLYVNGSVINDYSGCESFFSTSAGGTH